MNKLLKIFAWILLLVALGGTVLTLFRINSVSDILIVGVSVVLWGVCWILCIQSFTRESMNTSLRYIVRSFTALLSTVLLVLYTMRPSRFELALNVFLLISFWSFGVLFIHVLRTKNESVASHRTEMRE
jgi:hypothetical protein